MPYAGANTLGITEVGSRLSMIGKADSTRPGLRYVTIADDLERVIADGAYAIGDRLPSQHQLAREYGVSLTTLRAAVELLENRGHVRSEHGLGTYVTAASDRNAHALVVDDEPEAIELLKTIMDGESVRVTGARSKAQALQHLSTTQFDAVFLDLVMPGGSGVDALADFKLMELNVPVVLVTGAADAQMIAKAMEYGPLTLLRKPVHVSEVRAVLSALHLNGRAARRGGAR